MSFIANICFALLLRVIFMVYGLWQDSTMVVKYTDVDYYVFTDAATYLTKGESPYLRATYRYTPILAWFLTPNVYIGTLFGKTLFILSDVAVGYLIYKILRLRHCQHNTSLLCAQLWWYNPLPITVSSRGNAESLIAILVLGTLYCLLKRGRWFQAVAAVLYAISVHMKIYPVTYALPIYLMLGWHYCKQKQWLPFKLHRWIRFDVGLNHTRVMFVVIAVAVFVALTTVCYMLYGNQFLEETYFYHVTRRDIRHNFSPYFLMLYLTAEEQGSFSLGLLVFIPQVALLLLVAFRYCDDLPFCCFLQTFIFVTFNKVCTSQYFLWYLSLLPLIIPQLRLTTRDAVAMVTLWFVGQGLWLLPAYYLEFKGINTFIWLWISGLLFLTINVWIVYKLITNFTHKPICWQGQIVGLPRKDLPPLEEIVSIVFHKITGKHCKMTHRRTGVN